MFAYTKNLVLTLVLYQTGFRLVLAKADLTDVQNALNVMIIIYECTYSVPHRRYFSQLAKMTDKYDGYVFVLLHFE